MRYHMVDVGRRYDDNATIPTSNWHGRQWYLWTGGQYLWGDSDKLALSILHLTKAHALKNSNAATRDLEIRGYKIIMMDKWH